MAKADSRPKAIIKAAIRSKCHVIARRYPSQQLDKLHGSNVKWLVLSDELFAEVCSEFTIKKLELSHGEKRALFDADWVPQVTYELITKPARPRRRHATQRSTIRSESHATPPPPETCTSETIQTSQPTETRASSLGSCERSTSAERRATGKTEDPRCLASQATLNRPSSAPHLPGYIEGAIPRPAWFETVLN